MNLKIIADDKIPCLDQLLDSRHQLCTYPAQELTAERLRDADILLCRSVTKVDAALLQKSRIRFVATATSGYDHFDIEWLDSQSIQWAHAPGCNATAVAEYVVSVIAALRKENVMTQDKHLRAGVIGVGHVGKQVVAALERLGFAVLQNDPPRAAAETNFISTPLSQLTDLDLICIHTPLTYSGEYATFHMIEREWLQAAKPNAVLLNAGRGAVIHQDDLFHYGQHLICCLDVYENEPQVSPKIIQQAEIATPHIAGHSIQAKWRGAEMLYHAMQNFLNEPIKKQLIYPKTTFHPAKDNLDWADKALMISNPRQQTLALKNHPEQFTRQRNDYPIRHEFEFVEFCHS